MKVAVLKGGRSLERGVSLRSGARVEDALERLGHEVLPIDVGPDLVKRLGAERPDVAFVAMHGVGGEDGTVQELLEILGIPFTGPGAAACARCMDKVQAKDAIEEAGLPTPEWFAFNQTAFREFGAADALSRLEETLGFPLVVKPSRGGSSLGVKFAAAASEVPQALVSAFSYDDRVLIESFVDGRELAVSVLGDEPLPVVEAILLEGDRYDFEARYEIGRTRFACPAELSAEEERAVTEAALATYRALGCTGFTRIDLILGSEGPSLLEANAIPGLTDTSLLPQAAEAAGLSFEQLVERILDLALKPAAA
jgi:D-alanine-D-alanine ligase